VTVFPDFGSSIHKVVTTAVSTNRRGRDHTLTVGLNANHSSVFCSVCAREAVPTLWPVCQDLPNPRLRQGSTEKPRAALRAPSGQRSAIQRPAGGVPRIDGGTTTHPKADVVDTAVGRSSRAWQRDSRPDRCSRPRRAAHGTHRLHVRRDHRFDSGTIPDIACRSKTSSLSPGQPERAPRRSCVLCRIRRVSPEIAPVRPPRKTQTRGARLSHPLPLPFGGQAHHLPVQVEVPGQPAAEAMASCHDTLITG
jgi:hypothetical protein